MVTLQQTLVTVVTWHWHQWSAADTVCSHNVLVSLVYETRSQWTLFCISKQQTVDIQHTLTLHSLVITLLGRLCAFTEHSAHQPSHKSDTARPDCGWMMSLLCRPVSHNSDRVRLRLELRGPFPEVQIKIFCFNYKLSNKYYEKCKLWDDKYSILYLLLEQSFSNLALILHNAGYQTM